MRLSPPEVLLPSRNSLDKTIREYVDARSTLDYFLKTIKHNCAKCDVKGNDGCKGCPVNIMVTQIIAVL